MPRSDLEADSGERLTLTLLPSGVRLFRYHTFVAKTPSNSLHSLSPFIPVSLLTLSYNFLPSRLVFDQYTLLERFRSAIFYPFNLATALLSTRPVWDLYPRCKSSSMSSDICVF